MLEGLDKVNWAELDHAYGSAEDVPDLIRKLLSGEKETRENAIYELFGNIWHQGTVYEATASAIPFLGEILNAPNAKDREQVALLLAAIASGNGFLEVHARDETGRAIWAEILSDKGKDLETEMESERKILDSVHRAVFPFVEHLAPYLVHDNEEVRESVAIAFGRFPELKEKLLPALNRALETERNETVRKRISFSLEKLTQ